MAHILANRNIESSPCSVFEAPNVGDGIPQGGKRNRLLLLGLEAVLVPVPVGVLLVELVCEKRNEWEVSHRDAKQDPV